MFSSFLAFWNIFDNLGLRLLLIRLVQRSLGLLGVIKHLGGVVQLHLNLLILPGILDLLGL